MSEQPFRIGPYWLSKRPDGRSSYWYITWYDPGAGTERRKSTRTADLEEAKSVITEHFLTSTRRPKEAPDEAVVALIFADYLEEHAAKKPSAERAVISIQHFMAFLDREQKEGRIVGAAKVSDVTPRLIRRFISWRKGPHSYTYESARDEIVEFRSKGVTPTSISRDISVVRAAISRAYKNGELASMPFIPDVDEDEKSPPRSRVLTQQEFARLLDVAPPHLFMYLMLAFCTAGRRAAILQLTPANVDWVSGLIDLNQKGRAQTRKRRPVLPITQALAPWLRGCTGPTFVHYEGRPVRSIKTAFRTARDQAGLGKDVIPGTIRHTVATELRKRGIPKWEVEAWMGHSSTSTTDQYAKYDPDYLRRAAAAIDDYFRELTSYTTRHVRDMTGVVPLDNPLRRTSG